MGVFATCYLAFGVWAGWSSPAIPNGPPDEANRLHHPRGFSIVVPAGWVVHVTDADPYFSLSARPWSRFPRRIPVGISVRRCGPDEPTGPSDDRPTEFQGLPAREGQEVRQLIHERPLQFAYRLTFRRGDSRYEISYLHPGVIRTLPDAVRDYLSTFRVDEEPPDTPDHRQAP